MNKKKTFTLLLIAQSLSAFGDNAVYSVIMGVLLELVKQHQITLQEFGVRSAVYANCLFLPYVIFAPVLGWISDRNEKRSVLIAANAIKALGALVAVAGIAAGRDFLVAAYLLVGLGAAVYSPSKYGIIPELKSEEELVKANAAVEMTTIIAILTGIIGGGFLVDTVGARTSFLVLAVLYAAASFLNFLMDRSRLCNPDELLSRTFIDFWTAFKRVVTTRLLLLPLLGTTIFWASASFVKLNLQTWGQAVLRLVTATQISLLALWLSIGIILGSFAAGRWFRTGEIRRAWAFGFAMGGAILLLVLDHVSYGLAVAELILLGAVGGLFLIPLNAEIQARSDRRNIGKVIAIQHLFENGSMFLSAGLFWSFNKFGLSSTMTFVIIGIFLCLVNVLWLRPRLKTA